MQKRISNDALARLVESAALATGNERRQARRALLGAIVSDGRTTRDARTLVDRFVSEARHWARDMRASNPVAEITQG